MMLSHHAGDGGKKARSPGRARISRKAIAQGRPDCLRFTCMLVCAFPVHQCTRDRGCSAHPVFPAPFRRGANEMENLGQKPVARTMTHIPSSSPGACPRPDRGRPLSRVMTVSNGATLSEPTNARGDGSRPGSRDDERLFEM